jgi:hypothetical protein
MPATTTPTTTTTTTVTIASRSLWRIRLARELPRYLLYALAVTGLLASARFAIAPPQPAARAAQRVLAPRDLAAEGFASLFARRYLTWDGNDLEAHQRALAPFIGSGMDPDAGLQQPSGGNRSEDGQQVQWTQVVQEREPTSGQHVYTVATQTDTAGLLYLTVSVIRKADGALALAGYPAFVGAPAAGGADTSGPGRLRAVEDTALATVVERALRNYLAGSASELAADLTSDARVSLPGLELALQSVQSLDWCAGGGSVLAVLRAQDARGAQYTLDYELDVARRASRWEVSAIQMDPDT